MVSVVSYVLYRLMCQRSRWAKTQLCKPALGRMGLWVVALGLGGFVGVISPNPAGLGTPAQAQALQPEVRDPFLADPLADNPRDPLLPTPSVDRPLSPLELYALEQDLNQLAREAEALAEADQPEAAKEQWMREVRLRRVLGIEAELEAIDRVAQWLRDTIATQELQLLSARLDQILPTLDPAQPGDRAQLAAMANTYTTLGNVETAATLRRTLAEEALARGDSGEHRAQLESLATLYADWFYFPEAAATYGELVALAQGEGDDELGFWVRQIENLEFAQQFEAALEAQQPLLLRYRAEEDLWPRMAALQYAMAQNHQRLGDVETASRQYQLAYTNAIGSRQLEIAAQTLNALASLYRQLEQWPDVDYLYQQLLTVERQALDAYGLMETFDQIGQLYEQSGNLDGAMQAYQEGLALAKQINHRQDYFAAQVDRLSPTP